MNIYSPRAAANSAAEPAVWDAAARCEAAVHIIIISIISIITTK